MDQFIDSFVAQTLEAIGRIDREAIAAMVDGLTAVKRRGGRLFIVGSGGGAGHASHAVNDFRKIVDLEAYAPTDNVSELTARINDDGWESSYASWLRTSRFRRDDALLVLSVGGGNVAKRVSVNLVRCIEVAREVGAAVFGIVGRDGGYTKVMADACVVIPVVDPELVTPHTEGLQAVVWHLLVSHPKLKSAKTKWESVAAAAH
jgi:D-sedoheptulose 7-phosphate isomerase